MAQATPGCAAFNCFDLRAEARVCYTKSNALLDFPQHVGESSLTSGKAVLHFTIACSLPAGQEAFAL
jgi:hypothetical protein